MANPGSDTIAGLLQRARSGDRPALDRLFALGRSFVAVVARTQVESWIQAKFDPSDIVQQSLLEAYRSFDGFQGATGPEWLAWLRQIVAHNAVDFARCYCGTDKRQVRREIPIAPPADHSSLAGAEPLDNAESPSQQALAHERELLLAAALDQLAPDHREVILLRNLQGLPFDEVARRMDRSRPAAQMLWMRAIRCLQEQLQGQNSCAV